MATEVMDDMRGIQSEMLAELRQALDALVGLAPWSVTMGTAWHFSLDWGGKVTHGAGRLAVSQGEYRLLVAGSWRLEDADHVICTWRNFGKAGESGLASLTGRRVTSVRVLPPGHDLEITFEGALTLRVFSDREAAFILFSPGRAFGVEEDGRLEVAS